MDVLVKDINNSWVQGDQGNQATGQQTYKEAGGYDFMKQYVTFSADFPLDFACREGHK